MLKNKKIEDFSDNELEHIMDTRIQMGKEKSRYFSKIP